MVVILVINVLVVALGKPSYVSVCVYNVNVNIVSTVEL